MILTPYSTPGLLQSPGVGAGCCIWLLWLGSLALSVTLVVLLRTRWGQSRPLQKCAVLSLLVHLMLACLAMTVRIVVGDGVAAGRRAADSRAHRSGSGRRADIGECSGRRGDRCCAAALLEPPPDESNRDAGSRGRRRKRRTS